MSALGDTLRTAREAQGLSLSDVAERIHIRAVYLAAIEAEDWRAIGPPVYVRGFVRVYARSLGLDPDAAVARLTDGAAGVAMPPQTRADHVTPGLSRGEQPKRGLSLWAIAGVLVALALVLFVGYQYIDYQRAQPVAVRGSRPAAAKGSLQPEGVSGESHARAGSPASPELRPIVQNQGRSSGFEVRLKDSSWVRVLVDGKVAMEGLYPKGTTRTFSGRSATVRVGNAGGVDIAVDGKDLGPMGGLGDVAERSFQL